MPTAKPHPIWWAATAVMALLAVLKLGPEYWRLVVDQTRDGAIDLKFYNDWAHQWVAGVPIYLARPPAEYPPATYLLLWPVLGWMPFGPARWFWAATTIPVLTWLAWLCIRESGATSGRERAFVVLMLLSLNATGVAIGNGQLILHVLPILMAAVAMLRSDRSLAADVAAAGLLIVALVKPAVSVPFLCTAFLVAGRIRPVVFVVAGYGVLTLVAAVFQHAAPWSLLMLSLAQGSKAAVVGGYGNVHFWLAALGQRGWILAASALVLLVFGLWIHRHRRADLGLLVSVTAIVARLWTYHRLYDDVLTIVPMVFLFRVARQSPRESRIGRLAAGLLGATLLMMWLPARLSRAAPPWDLIFTAGHTLVWLILLGFFMWLGHRAPDALSHESSS